MSALLDLAARCEQATGPDRELDAHLHCVREELEFVLIATGREAYGDICDPSDRGYGTPNTCTSGLLYARYPDHKNPPTLGGGVRGNKVQGCTPDPFTASLDAAMTLVPEGWWKDVFDADNGDALCALWHEDSDTEINTRGKTWPLALCAAALRARGEQLTERKG